MTTVDQPNLWDMLTKQTIGAPHNGTQTSIIAARMIAPKVGSLKAKVLAYVREVGGATCDEAEVALEMLHTTASARFNELVHEGFLRDSGLRRETRWHRPAVVWVSVSPSPAEDFSSGEMRKVEVPME